MKDNSRYKGNFRARNRRLYVLVFLGMLSACAPSDIIVEGTLPVPLVKKIPIDIGVFYSREFLEFVYVENSKELGDWQVDFREQNEKFFSSLFESMFLRIVNLDEWGNSKEMTENVQAILVPKIKEYGFLTPFVSGLGFYSASIEYELTLYDDTGEQILEWTVVGYGKSEGGVFAREEAVEQATLLAIRDAGARIAIEFDKQEPFQKWYRTLEIDDDF
tara:strand:- start:409 stop:1062 length:654 start_codon:yes stop_codon:yes gene_type:complete